MVPDCTCLIASIMPGLERDWLPCWHMRLYFFAAATRADNREAHTIVRGQHVAAERQSGGARRRACLQEFTPINCHGLLLVVRYDSKFYNVRGVEMWLATSLLRYVRLASFVKAV